MTAMDNLSEHSATFEEIGKAATSVQFLTYIRPVAMGEHTGYAVCTEDGVQLAVFGSHEAAFFSARQHNLEPVSLH